MGISSVAVTGHLFGLRNKLLTNRYDGFYAGHCKPKCEDRNTMTTMTRTRAPIAGALVLAWSVSLNATDDVTRGRDSQRNRKGAIAVGNAAASITATRVPQGPIRVQNTRIEAAPRQQPSPSATLKFDLFNQGATSVTDIVLEVSIVEKPASDQPFAPGRELIRPFKIRGTVILQAGYTLNYEMVMRNFSSDCNCVAHVEVESVRALFDSGS